MRSTINRRGRLTKKEQAILSDWILTITGVTDKEKNTECNRQWCVSLKTVRSAIEGNELSQTTLYYIRLRMKQGNP